MDTCKEEEKREDKRNTAGIKEAYKTIRSDGILIFPSPKEATNQKNKEVVAPIDNRKPLLIKIGIAK